MMRSQTALFRLAEKLRPQLYPPEIDSFLPAGNGGRDSREGYALSSCFFILTGALLLFALWPLVPDQSWTRVGFFIALVPLTFLAIQLIAIILGALPRDFHLTIWILTFTGAAIWMIRQPSWIRWVGFFWLGIVGLNFLAWILQNTDSRIIRHTVLVLNLLAPIVTVGLFLEDQLVLGLGLLVGAHLLFLLPSLIPNHPFFGPTVTHFQPNGPEVWLTIDDGPTIDTESILDLLERHDAKATFFLVGQRAQKLRRATREIARRGHQIGNHTDSHPAGLFWAYFPWALRNQIDHCTASLGEILKTEPTIFRPPVGFKNPWLQGILRRAGLTHIGWCARGFDGVASQPEQVVARLRPRLQRGAIILAHQGRENSLEVLEAILEELKTRQLRCVIPSKDQWRPDLA